ncbi:trypsin-like serine peptidase [Jatrophihabitans sp.]|jgi:V8-like Glu-specific endopeptidase|uniref:trypsin-like serine peptidase n=1 Tax=Jatrophihabitans sp. TaxID=1932789 RepID=UPI002F065D4C
MFNGRRWPVAGLLAGVAALAVATVTPAQAAGTPAGSASTVSTVSTAAATSGAGLASASGYWTTQRMANARSGDLLAPKPSAASTAQSTPRGGVRGSVAPSAATKPLPQSQGSARSRSGDVSTMAVSASATVGRAFFHNPTDGLDYSCSASALNSGSKELVLTAGHCVHGGAGGTWATNWVFVPLYNYGSQPYGQWSAKYFTTFNSWMSSSDLNRDVAMVTMWPNGSGALVNVVGGNGLAWNWGFYNPVTILGYPAQYPYDGGWQWACQGTTTRFGSEYKVALQCGFTGGSSGGPWLLQYDNNTGLGYANGAMSTLEPSTGWNRASYFDDAVYNMYASVANLT